MKQTIIAFTGISGVGKTTFLKKVSDQIQFQHLTGGSLISAARSTPNNSRDELRNADLDENQRLLILGFFQTRDSHAAIVIMDGHVIIDGENGITEIDSQVFAELEVSLMVHLFAEPEMIAQNRDSDSHRDRPFLSVDVLRTHQERSIQRAADIASVLEIDFLSVTHSQVSTFVEKIHGLT